MGQQLLYTSSAPAPPMEIVGVVGDVREGPLDASARPTMYVAFDQDPTEGFAVFARTSQAEDTVLPALAAAINHIDPGITTFNSTTMTAIINDSQAAYVRRSSASLVSGFAAVAWLLESSASTARSRTP